MSSGVVLSLNTGVVGGKVAEGVSRGVLLAAEHLRATAVERTPIGVTGQLRASAFARLLTLHQAAVYYSIIYANRQHEEEEWNHPRGGQAKFLESAAEESHAEIKGVMMQAIRGMM